jgi:hypothetical protein
MQGTGEGSGNAEISSKSVLGRGKRHAGSFVSRRHGKRLAFSCRLTAGDLSDIIGSCVNKNQNINILT